MIRNPTLAVAFSTVGTLIIGYLCYLRLGVEHPVAILIEFAIMAVSFFCLYYAIQMSPSEMALLASGEKRALYRKEVIRFSSSISVTVENTKNRDVRKAGESVCQTVDEILASDPDPRKIVELHGLLEQIEEHFAYYRALESGKLGNVKAQEITETAGELQQFATDLENLKTNKTAAKVMIAHARANGIKAMMNSAGLSAATRVMDDDVNDAVSRSNQI